MHCKLLRTIFPNEKNCQTSAHNRSGLTLSLGDFKKRNSLFSLMHDGSHAGMFLLHAHSFLHDDHNLHPAHIAAFRQDIL